MIDIREAATRKIGPLPAWAWGVVVGGGLLVYSFATGKGASSPFEATLAGGTPYDFDAAAGGASGGGGGGAIDGGSPNGGTVTPTTPTSPVTHTPNGPVTTTPSVGGRRNGTIAPNVSTPITPLVKSNQRTRPGTGDTDPNPLPLGLPLPRWEAIAATQAQAAASYLSLPPQAPSVPIPVPGSVTYPTLPPIIRAQGDTRKIDPRGWATAARARARAGIIPTTARRPVTLPPIARDALGRIRPRQIG